MWKTFTSILVGSDCFCGDISGGYWSKYSRFGGGRRIKQGFLLSSFSSVYAAFSHLSLWVPTICWAWCGFIICNGSTVGFLSYLCAVEPTQQFLCIFCLSSGLKPAGHNNLNNGSPLENRITSDKIKAAIFSITRSQVDTYCLFVLLQRLPWCSGSCKNRQCYSSEGLVCLHPGCWFCAGPKVSARPDNLALFVVCIIHVAFCVCVYSQTHTHAVYACILINKIHRRYI